MTAEVELLRGARKVYSSLRWKSRSWTRRRPGVARFMFQIPLAKIPAGQYTAQVNVIDDDRQEVRFPAQRDLRVAGADGSRGAGSGGSGQAPPAQPNQ